ncbi:MAG: hypothetical protein L0H24_04440 [Microlunatus sp.]|nr:hypothetical protein [Microlunatus sp.]
MPNVVRGERMSGLMVYLAGPGRHNEHDEPHLVAGDDALMTWYRDVELDSGAALTIARHLDRPRKLFGTEVTTGVYELQQTGRGTDGQPTYKRVRTGTKPAHVWHCSLSLRADEGQLSDEKWGQIASDFVRAMEFDDNQGSKAPCRWVAVRHGLSSDGNDHVHLAVSLVRDDGTKASTHKDFYRTQRAARALEVVHGLERLESSVAGEPGATRGFTPAEQRRAEERAAWVAKTTIEKRQGAGAWDNLTPAERRHEVARRFRLNLPREVMARKVRGCAAASADEGEFVRRLRKVGLLVRPRFAEGTQDVITGYSVADRPASRAERPIWYGGNRLARDLGLARLREHSGWPDDPVKASEAAAEWNAAYRNRRIVAPGRETTEPAPEATAKFAEQLASVSRDLRSIPLDDHAAWARTAREISGVLAAWSVSTEATPGPLAHASHMLARSAQTYRRQEPMPGPARRALAGTALLVSAGAKLGRGPVGQAAMMHELILLTATLVKVVQESQARTRAAELLRAAQTNLTQVHARIEAGETARQPDQRGPASTTPAAEQTAGAGTATLVRDNEPRADAKPLDPELQKMIALVRAGQAPATEATRAPVPRPLEKAPDRRTSDTEADRGVGR